MKIVSNLDQWRSSFKPLKETVKTRNIIGFDSEDNGERTPVSFVFYSDDGPYYCRRREDAINYIYSVEKPSVFVAHNLEYDLNNIFQDEHWHFYDSLHYSSNLISARLKARNHTFMDSGCFFRGPLWRMGKIIGFEKIEDERQDIFNREYVTRDAEIVYRFMKKFQEKLNNELNINLGITIGQIAMKSFRARFMDSTIHTYNSPLCLESYYGGRVEIFYKGLIQDKVYVSDINSSYPNVMMNELYPHTGTIQKSSIDTHEFGVGRFKVHVPDSIHIPPLPFKSSAGRLFFPKGTFSGCWTYAEMRYAQSIGVEILEEYTGEGTNMSISPFCEFIDSFYTKRQKSKKMSKKHPDNVEYKFEDLLNKLIMNNLYGKFAQHLPSTTVTRHPLLPWEEDNLDGRIKSIQKRLGFYCYTVEKYQPPTTANYMWGTYITSYARINLHKGLQAVHNNGGTLLYCDTDSIMYSKLDTPPVTISSRLGDWDNEQFDMAYFDQSKGYLLCEQSAPNNRNEYIVRKCACKGVPSRFMHTFFMRGKAFIPKPIKLRESLVLISAHRNNAKNDKLLNELGANYWREVEKAMRSIYIKRKGKKGVTKPVDVSEIHELEQNTHNEGKIGIGHILKKAGIIVHEKSTEDNKTLASQQKEKFTKREIPEGWFVPFPPPKMPDLSAATPHFARKSDLHMLQAGDVWIKGYVFGMQELKNSEHFLIHCDIYMNKICPPAFVVKLSGKFLETYLFDQEILNKNLEIQNLLTYINNEPEQLSIKIYEPLKK